MRYEPSRFNVWIPDYPKKGFSLVYNTLQRSLICVPAAIEEAVLKRDLSGVPEETLTALLFSNILIEAGIDEEKVFKNWLGRYSLDTQTLGLTLITTYACNCRCVYCYEDGVRKPGEAVSVMPAGGIKKLSAWTENLVKLWRPRTLDFCFHGGEPSIYPDVVDTIAKSMRAIADRNNLKPSFSIVTNGTLMTNRFIGVLKDNGINRVMSTLDGPEEVHNKRRPLCSGVGTFAQTFKGLECLVKEGFRVFLGINIDKGNIAYIPKLLEILAASGFATSPNFSILFGAIKEGPEASNPAYFKKNAFSNSGQMNAFTSLYRLALDKKIRIADPVGGGLCSFRRMDSYIIDVEGNLYKCITQSGNKKALVGNISSPVSLTMRKSAQFIYIEPWQSRKKCRLCRYLPLCMGGCRQQTLLKKGSYDDILCTKSYFDKYLPEAIKIKYDSAVIFPKTPQPSVDTEGVPCL